MMNRRALFLTLLLTGCGLSERPYAERRQWPLVAPRQSVLPPRRGGRVLEVRTLRAGPSLDTRGLVTLQPDGSMRSAFYEEWAVPPAQGVEEALRRWLAGSGLYAAVVAPGSRALPDLSLEGEVNALWSDPARGIAQAGLAITVVSGGTDHPRVLLQRNFTEQAGMQGDDPRAQTQAMLAALALVLARVEAALRSV